MSVRSPGAAPIIGREVALEQHRGGARRRRGRRSGLHLRGGRAGHRQDARCSPSCTIAPMRATSSCSRAARRSSSASSRSVPGSMRSMPTPHRRSTGCARPGTPRRSRELAPILPSLRSHADAAGRTVTDERYRIHRAVRGLLELLAEEQPLVVVLDDLHWADEASLALLAALLRRPARGPVLIALAFRPAQAPRQLAAALDDPVAAEDRARAPQRGSSRRSCSAISTRARPPRSTARAEAIRSTSSSSRARVAARSAVGRGARVRRRSAECPPPSPPR